MEYHVQFPGLGLELTVDRVAVSIGGFNIYWYGVIIAAAGKAAHLGGVLAAQTTLPVIGVPIKSSFMDGLDSLLSIVQMPSGIPVATVGVNGAENAAILAVQMLALSEPELASKLDAFKAEMAQKVEAKDAKIRAQFAK